MRHSHLNEQTTIEPAIAIVTRRHTTPLEPRARRASKLAPLQLASLQSSARIKIGQQAVKHFENRDLRRVLFNVGVLDQVDQALGRIQYAQYLSATRYACAVKQQSSLRQAEPVELPQVKVDTVEIRDDEIPEFPLQLSPPEYPLCASPAYFDGVIDSPSESDSDSDSDSDRDPDFDIDGEEDDEDEEEDEQAFSRPSCHPSSESISVAAKSLPHTQRLSPLSITRKLRSYVSQARASVLLQTAAAAA